MKQTLLTICLIVFSFKSWGDTEASSKPNNFYEKSLQQLFLNGDRDNLKVPYESFEGFAIKQNNNLKYLECDKKYYGKILKLIISKKRIIQVQVIEYKFYFKKLNSYWKTDSVSISEKYDSVKMILNRDNLKIKYKNRDIESQCFLKTKEEFFKKDLDKIKKAIANNKI